MLHLHDLPTPGEDVFNQPRPQVVEEGMAKRDRENAYHQAVDHEGDPKRESKHVAQTFE